MAECPDCGATDRDIYNTLGVGFACPHAVCPMSKDASLFADLRDLTKRWNTHEDIPRSQQIECRQIGEKLNALGGFDLMTAAYRDVRGQNPAAHVIAAYWDGIGDWVW